MRAMSVGVPTQSCKLHLRVGTQGLRCSWLPGNYEWLLGGICGCLTRGCCHGNRLVPWKQVGAMETGWCHGNRLVP